MFYFLFHRNLIKNSGWSMPYLKSKLVFNDNYGKLVLSSSLSSANAKLGTGKDNNRLWCSWARLDRPYAYPRSTHLIVGPNIDAQRPEARRIG